MKFKIIVSSPITAVAIGFGINEFKSNEEKNDLNIGKNSPVSDFTFDVELNRQAVSTCMK